MTKEQIDNYFTKNYNKLINISNNIISKYNRKYDSSFVLSECYLSINKINKNKKINCLEAFIIHWLKLNIMYSRSPLNYTKVNETMILELDDNIDLNSNEDILDDIEKLTDNFTNTLSTYDKSLFNLYYHQHIDTGKKMAEYLNQSLSSGTNTIKEAKSIMNQFRTFIENYNILKEVEWFQRPEVISRPPLKN